MLLEPASAMVKGLGMRAGGRGNGQYTSEGRAKGVHVGKRLELRAEQCDKTIRLLLPAAGAGTRTNKTYPKQMALRTIWVVQQ